MSPAPGESRASLAVEEEGDGAAQQPAGESTAPWHGDPLRGHQVCYKSAGNEERMGKEID